MCFALRTTWWISYFNRFTKLFSFAFPYANNLSALVTLRLRSLSQEACFLPSGHVSGKNVYSKGPVPTLTASQLILHTPQIVHRYSIHCWESKKFTIHYSLTSGTSLSPWLGSFFFRYSGAFVEVITSYFRRQEGQSPLALEQYLFQCYIPPNRYTLIIISS